MDDAEGVEVGEDGGEVGEDGELVGGGQEGHPLLQAQPLDELQHQRPLLRGAVLPEAQQRHHAAVALQLRQPPQLPQKVAPHSAQREARAVLVVHLQRHPPLPQPRLVQDRLAPDVQLLAGHHQIGVVF